MKTRYLLISMIIAIVVVLMSGTQVLAARGCADDPDDPANPLQYVVTNDKAPGTKYSGTMTIYYANVYTPAGTYEPNLKDMYFFARMEQKKNLYSFAGMEPDMTWGGDEIDRVPEQQAVIDYFFENTVVPWLFMIETGLTCIPGEEGDCPPYAIRSVEKGVEDHLWTSSGLIFAVFDFTIAIDY